MLRKIKTKLTKDDLQKPSLNLDAAVQEDAGVGSATGALFLPEDKHIAQALQAPAAPKNSDWMLKGDPAAPALKDLEARALEERQKAMMAAAQSPVPIHVPGGEPIINDPVAALPTPAPVPADDQLPQASYQPPTTAHFPWAPTPVATAAAPVDDVDQYAADMGVTFGSTAPVKDSLPAITPLPSVTTYTDQPAPSPFVSTMPEVASSPDEVVIRISHDPATEARPAETIMGAAEPRDAFASGAAVKIQHEPLNSLPYSPPNPQQKTSEPKAI